jgi:hypothetical protein
MEAGANWYTVDFPDRGHAERFARELRNHRWVERCNRRKATVKFRPNLSDQGHELGVPIIDMYSRLGGVMRPCEFRVARRFLARQVR